MQGIHYMSMGGIESRENHLEEEYIRLFVNTEKEERIIQGSQLGYSRRSDRPLQILSSHIYFACGCGRD